MTETTQHDAYLSPVDLDLLRIETPMRPMHWCFLIKLRPSATQRIEFGALRDRVIERAEHRGVFRMGVRRNRFSPPTVYPDSSGAQTVRVAHITVAGEAELRYQVGRMLTSFADAERLWDITLADDVSSQGQYLIVRLHHCLGDGPAASGFAYLVMDGGDNELAQFDRYLVSPRFEMFDVGTAALVRSWRHLFRSWWHGVRRTRPPLGPTSPTRVINYAALSAAAVNQAARSHGATQMEFLLATMSMEMRRLLRTEMGCPAVVRTLVPVTLDLSLRHTGNATAFAIVNLPLTLDSLHAALANIRQQLRDNAAERPDYALPTLTQNSRGPWLYKRLAAIAIMRAVGSDLDVGLNPLHVTMESVFGVPVDNVFPFSPLVYTPISLAALILGDKLTIGINADACAVGNIGEVVARELAERLTDAQPADSPIADLRVAARSDA
ncbi:MAG: wax ester/triacylglycerol synthase domain-containing protein [Mycobacterium sp.]|uniref:wax ester/triacylglycerol synthase domain-containing protein n=1 Tax=Mycobacterium sp. TaxID=1785 RepID=UPI003CC5E99F